MSLQESFKDLSPVVSGDEALEAMLQADDAFAREDETDDRVFYARPRIVEHLDAGARQTVSRLLSGLMIERQPRVLDLMAAVSSHLPPDRAYAEVTGLGLNADELAANRQLDRRIVHDLNEQPVLPFEDGAFDVVLNTVSIQYVTRPDRLFEEVGRILKPGGVFVVIFSNRTFPTKAVKLWELLADDERLRLLQRFFRTAGMFESSQTFIQMGDPRPADDKYHSMGIPGDPVFAVFAEKEGGAAGRPARTAPQRAVDMPSADEIRNRKAVIAKKMLCPYCETRLYRWKITENPWTTWDHDLYVCINDSCPYTVRGWQEMYLQGNPGTSYRFVYDKLKDCSLTVPVPNLNVIKDAVELQD